MGQQQLYGLVRYSSALSKISTMTALSHETIQADGTTSIVDMKKNNDAKLSKKQQRRWGRSITTGCSETQGEVGCVASTRPPLVQEPSASNDDPAPSVDNDSARDVRR